MARIKIPDDRLIELEDRLSLLPAGCSKRKRFVLEFAQLYDVSANTVYRSLRKRRKPRPLRRSDSGQPRIIGKDQMEKYCRIIALMALLMPFYCLNGCNGGGSNPGTDIPSESMATGWALLGPLTGATVEVYQWDDLKNSIYSTTTTESTEFASAGRFSIPKTILDNDRLYIIMISGGSNIDADNDGIVDDTPAANLGTLHLVATGWQLSTIDCIANILTDIVYHKVAYFTQGHCWKLNETLRRWSTLLDWPWM